MRRWLKRKLINFIVKRLYKFITVDDIMVQKADGFYVGDTRLEKKHLQELKQQADVILNLEAYKLIQKELAHAANVKMFRESKDFDDMYFGKAMLYCLDVIHKKLTKLSQI